MNGFVVHQEITDWKNKKINYSKLWEPVKINGMTLRNRIVMSPMGTYTPMQDGTESEEGMRYYEERAKGGAGMIMTGAIFVSEALCQGSPSVAVWDIHAIPKTTVMVERVHRWGAKFCLQLSPGTGRNAVLGRGADEALVSASENPAYYDPNILCREMSKEEIKKCIENYKVAADFALKCGFDAIEIHAHNAYLIEQFLSPKWNRRTDEYGGCVENRCRFAVEIIQAVREIVGPSFPIFFRISLDHQNPGAFDLTNCMDVLPILEAAGVDVFDTDAGSYEANDFIFTTKYVGDNVFEHVSKAARPYITKPMINSGALTIESAVRQLEEGTLDLVQFGRQCIADPQWPNKIREGRREDIRPCILCTEECIGRIFGRSTQVSCAVNPNTGFETHMEVTPVSKPTHVVVIGAGPGGLEAARCAAERGCQVDLYDKGDVFGGTFRTISTGDFKHRMRELIDWYQVQLEKLGVRVHMNCEISADDKVLLEADRIVVATGSQPVVPPIPGIDNSKVIEVYDVHKRQALPEGKNVVICGGGLSAIDTAFEYAPLGDRSFTIIEMRDKIGADVNALNAYSIVRLIPEYGIKTLVNSKVVGINDTGVEIEKLDGTRETVPADVIVAAFGRKPNMELADTIRYKYPTKTTVVGDCAKPGKCGNAIREGYYAAMEII